jgi:hypothetical protein
VTIIQGGCATDDPSIRSLTALQYSKYKHLVFGIQKVKVVEHDQAEIGEEVAVADQIRESGGGVAYAQAVGCRLMIRVIFLRLQTQRSQPAQHQCFLFDTGIRVSGR